MIGYTERSGIVANVFDVARYILKSRGPMSTMKLQKLCYYTQAWSLVWDDEPLFFENFEAWANGPVCPELFDLHRGRFKVSETDVPSAKCEGNITANQKDTIDIVLAHYGDKDAQWLSTLTHMEEPWKIARAGLPSGVRCNNIITQESMAMYYGGL